MAEFCPAYWNRTNETADKSEDYILSRRLELCEGCGEWKRVVIAKRKHYFRRRLGMLFRLGRFGSRRKRQ